MSPECFISAVERQKLTENGLNKPMQKISYVRYALLEIVIERDCGRRCS